MSLDREAVEVHLEATLVGMTIAAGYNLPKNLGLVSREPLDYDETAGRRPAAIIQITSAPSERVGTGGVSQTTLMGRVVYYFDVNNTSGMIHATLVNLYMRATRDALLADRSRGANPQVLDTTIPDEPTASLWKTGQAIEATLLFEVLCRHEGGV
jgi:hypothetical protein